jgi:hypothetical protein
MPGRYSTPALQQHNLSPPVPAQQNDSFSYPTPQYEDVQQQVQTEPQTMQYPLKAQGYHQQHHQQQQQQQRGSQGPFAQKSTQQAVLAGAQAEGAYSSRHSGGCGAAGALNPAPRDESHPESDKQQQQQQEYRDSDDCENPEDIISTVLPQVVDVSSGQVLKVTSGEFQDILTVMLALAGTWTVWYNVCGVESRRGVKCEQWLRAESDFWGVPGHPDS